MFLVASFVGFGGWWQSFEKPQRNSKTSMKITKIKILSFLDQEGVFQNTSLPFREAEKFLRFFL